MRLRGKKALCLLAGLVGVTGFVTLLLSGQGQRQSIARSNYPTKAMVGTRTPSRHNARPTQGSGDFAARRPETPPRKAGAQPRNAASPRPTRAASGNGRISRHAWEQIAALEREKASRTPAERKIDSQLLYANKMRQGLPIADGVLRQQVDLDRDTKGRILLDIKTTVSPALLQEIRALGGHVLDDFPQYRAIRAALPLAGMEKLAARPDVAFIEPAVRATTSAVDSEGDYTHQASTARADFGVDGTGVKVGVISTTVDDLDSSQIGGRVTVLPGQSGLGMGYPGPGEGTAMLEIVNDLAPGAWLYFATGSGGEASFANNIQQLAAAGCDIIVDDESYSDESPFQDGIVAQAVNSVMAKGVLYFSAADNSGNEDDGTSGTWEGDFRDSGYTAGPPLPSDAAGEVHSFGSAVYDTVLGAGPGGNDLSLDLFWADRLGAAADDYDVYVVDSSGSQTVASSTDSQTGTQDPYEHCPALQVGDKIVIVKYSGSGRFLHLCLGRGLLTISTPGSTRGHNCAAGAFDVAASDAKVSYPYPFLGGVLNPVEDYSSDGPRRIFFRADGTAITPGNFSSTGGAVRQKPDITAADDVTTDVPGFAPFSGTSAAAPHAAAIAALLESYNPNLTPTQIRAILTGTALDIMSPGPDRDSGAGIVMALSALEAVPPPPEPDLTRGSDGLSSSTVHVGDVVTASLTITNASCSGGSADAGPFHVGFYWSTDPSFAGDSPFCEASLPGCPANGTVPLKQGVTISSDNSPGIYYLGYEIDDEGEVRECNGDNNGIFYWTVTVLPPPEPDLTWSSASLSNLAPTPGQVVTVSMVITNQACSGGSADAGPFHVGFYWSTSSSFSGDSPFYEASLPGCPAKGALPLNQSITITAATAPGTYYLGYKIDDEGEVAECDGGNNGIFYWKVNVMAPAPVASPQLVLQGRTSRGAVMLRVSGPSGARYAVEASSNLVDWLPLGTNVASGGYFDFTDSSASGLRRRFYRARQAP